MMAPEKLKPEDIDSAMAVSAQHVRPARHREEEFAPADAAPDTDRAPRQSDWLEDRQYEAEIPPYPEEDELRVDDDRIGVYEQRPASRRALPVVAGGVALLIVAGLVWWMFRPPAQAPGEEVPVVVAEAGDVKTRPADEGGMEVPNQDITVYDQISDQPPAAETEVVMPPPETPLTPTAVPDEPVSAAVEEPGAPADQTQSEIDAVLAQLQAASAAREAVPQPVGSIDATAPATGPDAAGTQVAEVPAVPEPVVLPAISDTGIKVQLAAFKSEDQARGAWSGFQQRFPGELSGLPLIIEQADLGAKGIFYRVQAGPLASREAAAALCGRLIGQGQTCIVAQ